jgi:hypothetical protein
MEQLSKNDLIRTPRGFLANVNYHNINAGMIGCSFIEGTMLPGLKGMIFKEEEVIVIKRGTQQFFNDLFKMLEKEELREVIKEERRMRSIQPTEKEKVVRKKSVMEELLGELGEDDLRELKKRSEVKRGGREVDNGMG